MIPGYMKQIRNMVFWQISVYITKINPDLLAVNKMFLELKNCKYCLSINCIAVLYCNILLRIWKPFTFNIQVPKVSYPIKSM